MKKNGICQDMDWQDFVEQLRKIGLELVTDVEWAEIPFYSCGVQAGLPNEAGDYAGETVTVPQEFLRECDYAVAVRGESMRDYDLKEGDKLLVNVQDVADNGDIVIASVDGGMTVKAYYEDRAGHKWLVPGNKNFLPISLDRTDARIMGRVRRIIHRSPRVDVNVLAQTVEEAQSDNAVDYGREAVALAVGRAREYMETKRMGESRAWFAVYRVFVDRGIVKAGDYAGFQNLLTEVLGDEAPVLNVRDMRYNLDVQSFAKPLSLWNANDAPVTLRRFFDYMEVARRTNEGLRSFADKSLTNR